METETRVKTALASVVVSTAVLLFVWAAIRATGVGDQTVPSVGQVAAALRDLFTDGFGGRSIWTHVSATISHLVAGWLVGVVLGSALGSLIGSNTTVRALLDPAVNFLRVTVPLAYVTLIASWVGVGSWSVVFSTAFLPFWIAADIVARWKSDHLQDTAASVEAIVAMLRVTLLVAALTLLNREVALSDAGLGTVAFSARPFLRVDIIFAVLFMFSGITLVLDYLIRLGGHLYKQRFEQHTVTSLRVDPAASM